MRRKTSFETMPTGYCGGAREGAEWVGSEGVGAGGEMYQALYAHMNNKRKRKKKGI
jgi:hypothetical protein